MLGCKPAATTARAVAERADVAEADALAATAAPLADAIGPGASTGDATRRSSSLLAQLVRPPGRGPPLDLRES